MPIPRRADHRERTRQDAVRLLADGGCPVCRGADSSDRLWVRSFVLEGNVEHDVLTGIAAARGLCARHLRRLLGRTDAAFLLPTALTHVALAYLDDLGEPGTNREHPACPACRSRSAEENDTARTLTPDLDGAEVQQALGQASICLPHTRMLLDAAPVPALVRHTAERIASCSGVAALEPLTGTDNDADARAAHFETLCRLDDADRENARRPTRDRLRDLLAAPSCPCCRAAALARIRYLRWLVVLRQDLDREPEPVEIALCPRHLHDLSSLDPLTAGWVADRLQPVVRGRLATLAAGLDEQSSRTLRGARAAAPYLQRYDASARACPTCRAEGVARTRTQELVAAAMADTPIRRALEDGHGLCAADALAASHGGDPLPAQVTRARLQVLVWELTEARRKREWWTRHEHQGREMGAWRTAPTWLCGPAYLGLGADESAD